jgi:hypothetical protein
MPGILGVITGAIMEGIPLEMEIDVVIGSETGSLAQPPIKITGSKINDNLMINLWSILSS